MRLYAVVFQPADRDTVVLHRANESRRWAGTIADAKRLQRDLESKHGRHNVGDWEPVDVPTIKQDLISFLNKLEGSQE